MIVTERKEITKKKTEVADILCNKCGESCKSYVFEDGGALYSGLLKMRFSHYEFSLCEKCTDLLMMEFKIEPLEIK